MKFTRVLGKKIYKQDNTMKNLNSWAIFIGGFVTGIVFLWLIQTFGGSRPKDVTFFENPGEKVYATQIKVERCLKDNIFQATVEDDNSNSYNSTRYVIIDENNEYYDKMVIKIMLNKEVRVVGVYDFIPVDIPMIDVSGLSEKLPIIQIVDKNRK